VLCGDLQALRCVETITDVEADHRQVAMRDFNDGDKPWNYRLAYRLAQAAAEQLLAQA